MLQMNRMLLKGSWSRYGLARSIASVPSVSTSSRALLPGSIYTCNSRALSSISDLRSQNLPPSSQSLKLESEFAKEEVAETQSRAPSQHIPWYLQEETPIAESQAVSSRDQIPELPEDPPAILPVLLDYVFKDLGLDGLKLFDLRGLDTPPALGANVIMIIGTARSVKHLNVCADRLCRWLRSTWKLTPYADGLLGRNELKIKLRRKARRARIASRAGAMVDEKDDGITTGWICVNAGVVEKAPVQEKAARSFEGFGNLVGGTRVVVQMFTEEKRADVDLEGLWLANLERAERKRQRAIDSLESKPDAPPKEVRVSTPVNTTSSDHVFRHYSRSSVTLPLEQRRGLHSRCRATPTSEDDLDNVRSNSAADSQFHDIANAGASHTGSVTDSLLRHLSGLPNDQVLSELGTGSDDKDSTIFLRLFNDALSELSPEEAAIAQIKLLCTAISRQHHAYSKQGLWTSFMNCSYNAYSLSDELGMDVVAAMLTEQSLNDQGGEAFTVLPESDRELALRVLEYLTLRGTDVLNMKVFHMLYRAASHPTHLSTENKEKVSERVKNQSTARVAKFIDILNISFDPQEARKLMLSLFRNEDYDGFWKLWQKLPLNGSPRTAADYEMLFELHAELGDERRARDCVSTWVPMMGRESPPIPLKGQVLQDIMYCLVIAEPDIDQMASEGSTSNLALIWNDCKNKLA
ncbi:RsfS/YbeB/iojap family protein [Aspergillus clavatus NRRL 1]|uniref:ATPase synthesis protein 25 n=1 Tax=Aspergillus clavatus (strain ATCC 1007 / CBS 513.65 / DSM 816 / NCTC 3887 / NRRL 1 / QM 1276 / 107) TaxID=344612 RepID=A1C805_ASPCL|nr:uncharacterized protein ACLA_075650 [Aspergillus clavatus NRRL 1]EAW14526.1 conserved hypothetical protein [Aspergillus clavatus NRRL 1]